jgi:hypothetical protein
MPAIGDSLLRSMGFKPHRCRMCRRRFYLFKLAPIRTFVSIVDRPIMGHREAEPATVVAATKLRPSVSWDILRHYRFW